MQSKFAMNELMPGGFRSMGKSPTATKKGPGRRAVHTVKPAGVKLARLCRRG